MKDSFGGFLKEKRIEQKLTLRKFSTMVKLSPEVVSSLENNEVSHVAPNVLTDIVQALQLHTEEIDHLHQLMAHHQPPAFPTETIHKKCGEPVVRIALRVAEGFQATNAEWRDFMEWLRKQEEIGGMECKKITASGQLR